MMDEMKIIKYGKKKFYKSLQYISNCDLPRLRLHWAPDPCLNNLQQTYEFRPKLL